MFVYPRIVPETRLFFTGAIPKEIGKATNLQELYLGGNKLSGEKSLQLYIVEKLLPHLG